MPVLPTLERLRQEDQELDYVKYCPKNRNKTHTGPDQNSKGSRHTHVIHIHTCRHAKTNT